MCFLQGAPGNRGFPGQDGLAGPKVRLHAQNAKHNKSFYTQFFRAQALSQGPIVFLRYLFFLTFRELLEVSYTV